ncbi:Thymidine kinase [Candidatus Westeberhardia cardiocondylae]|uniref:Thymidine kinase n=1 Tax=Candidatus Westeberhardia cardiocondylae TaxID=1594731 RepID=A0A0H5BWV8_9ENTR|nr:thymidine kinase [Candidatus Westeberhardia cardiocondylae]MCR3756459.1 thymidine/deoxyuridine kinase [Candidatus Westeberhardia cardiocondylae]CEN32197.1 Thymidine kinase [Candidatus Westeberhardia cardiocondylae]
MAKLYFYYSAMNAGKSSALLQSSYNYKERGMKTLIFTTEIDDRYEYGKVNSRIGLSARAKIFNKETNLFSIINTKNKKNTIHCVLIDECHFLNKNQVEELCNVVDILNIPVLCYGLRTDFQANLFTGSLWLLAWSDNLVELKTICFCGKKANRVLRIDDRGGVIRKGKQILIGDNNQYLSVCRKHFIQK